MNTPGEMGDHERIDAFVHLIVFFGTENMFFSGVYFNVFNIMIFTGSR